MAIVLVASLTAAPGPSGGTTAAIDTTGATLLVVSLATYVGFGTPVLTDSKGNTWIGLTAQAAGSTGERLWYCLSPVVGTGHTFSVSGSNVFPAIFVYAFSGVASYQTESGATGGVTSPLASGSVTPTANGALVVTGRAASSTVTDSVSPAGFTLASLPYTAGVSVQGSAAYYVQPTAAAINPAWSWIGSSAENRVATAVFLPAAAPTGPPVVVTQLVAETLDVVPNAPVTAAQVAAEILFIGTPVNEARVTEVCCELIIIAYDDVCRVTSTAGFPTD